MDAQAGTSIAISLRMAKAMNLARAGKIKEAQGLIAGDRTIPDHPLALQALAALVTSEGDYLRALKLWELLLQRDPHHAEARRMIDSIELWISRPAWMRYWPLAASTVVAVIVAVVFWALASGSTPATRPPTANPIGSGAGTPIAAPVDTPATPAPTRIAPSRPATTAQPAPTVTFPSSSGSSGSQQRRRTNTR